MGKITDDYMVRLIKKAQSDVRSILSELDMGYAKSEGDNLMSVGSVAETYIGLSDEVFFRRIEDKIDSVFEYLEEITTNDLMDSGTWHNSSAGNRNDSYGSQARNWDNAIRWLSGGGLGQAGVSAAISILGDYALEVKEDTFIGGYPKREDYEDDDEFEEALESYDEEFREYVGEIVYELVNSYTFWETIMSEFLVLYES